MDLTWDEIYRNAVRFSKRWENASNERAEAQLFLHEFLSVFGVDSKRVATFEQKVHPTSDSIGFIDLLWKGRILIEMKSRGRSLDRAFKQAKDYGFALTNDEDLPEYYMVCDFETIVLRRITTNQIWEIKTKQLKASIKKFSILTEHANKYDFIVDKELNTAAAYKMADLHDELLGHNYKGHQLQVYLVRLLFCLFADDSGIFSKDLFHKYILDSKADGTDLSGRIASLFYVLDTPSADRQQGLPDDLYLFPYVNGSLFKEVLQPAVFSKKMRTLVLQCCEFEWTQISPSIFGSMFQGVMDKTLRRSLGAHYTSEQTILKTIKPLFIEELYEEFERVKMYDKQLDLFHMKLSKLTFMDPACGCGNFLVVAYREIRMLELEVLKIRKGHVNQLTIGGVLTDYDVLVDLNQFYGIEIDDFACEIAKVAMYLMDHLMNNLVTDEFGVPYKRLPLHEGANINFGNALSFDWNDIAGERSFDYILGNPPFKGKRYQDDQQKWDMLNVFGKNFKGVGTLDYVSAWYKKASEYILDKNTKVAFVSTNSIVQGEQVPILWKPLLSNHGIHFDFAHQSFPWLSEGKGKAAVHCVIIGFSRRTNKKESRIFNNNGFITTDNISPYLAAAPTVFIERRRNPICDVKRVVYGSFALDDGNYTISEEEYHNILSQEPELINYLRPFIGADEFIKDKKRYCIWLKDGNLKEISRSKILNNKISAVREWRLRSDRKETVVLAKYPMLFAEIRHPKSGYYLAIPTLSSENRDYIPIGFLDSNIIASNQLQIIPYATLYDFGILTSSVLMIWMRTVAGRFKSDYRFSGSIVYNNFPWPDTPESQKHVIENAAQGILNARKLYPENNYNDLYNRNTMPEELMRAHNELDRAVMKAYMYKATMSEEDIVADLFKRYVELTK